jgi:hypothetical protein
VGIRHNIKQEVLEGRWDLLEVLKLKVSTSYLVPTVEH